ncbi:hypothetical protein LEP1GSC074_0097 [Leptospira noguchii str. Hook]|nr:hypothetical protein LEP1GSC074_0097 [Leptospira noguchii str. Hook]
MIQSTSFTNKGRNPIKIIFCNVNSSFNPLPSQTKEEMSLHSPFTHRKKMFQSTSFTNKGRNTSESLTTHSRTGFNPLPSQTKEEMFCARLSCSANSFQSTSFANKGRNLIA